MGLRAAAERGDLRRARGVIRPREDLPINRQTAGRVFDALGDPGRRSLVAAVAALGAATATELASELRAREATLQARPDRAKQLVALADAGLLRATRAGRETRYTVTPEPLGDAVAWMVDVGAEWDDRLEKLGRLLANRAQG